MYSDIYMLYLNRVRGIVRGSSWGIRREPRARVKCEYYPHFQTLFSCITRKCIWINKCFVKCFQRFCEIFCNLKCYLSCKLLEYMLVYPFELLIIVHVILIWSHYVHNLLHDMNENYMLDLLHDMLANTCLMSCVYKLESDATNFLCMRNSWGPVLE